MEENIENKDFIKIEVSQPKLIRIFISSILFYIVALFLWRQGSLENAIVINFNYVYKDEVSLRFYKLFTQYGMPLITVIFACLLSFSFIVEKLRSERPLFYLILFLFLLTTVGGDLLKELIDRARPAVSLAEQIANKQISLSPAFPSGHAAKSMALALPIVLLASRRSNIIIVAKILLLLVAILVCYSRIALQAHFLSDVIAGVGTALFFIPFAIWVTNKYFIARKIDEFKINQLSRKLVIIFILLSVILCIM